MDEGRSDFKRVFRHARMVFGWLMVLLVALYTASGFYSVKPEQRGVVKRFGRVVTDNVAPGIHYHWPWPVESVIRLDTTKIRSATIYFGQSLSEEAKQKAQEQGSAVKTTEGSSGQETEATQQEITPTATPSPETTPASPQLKVAPLLTGDENLVLTRLLVQYTITQPKDYLYHTTDPEGLLHRIVQSRTITKYAGMSVDDVLTIGRLQIQQQLKDDIQASSDAHDLGLRIASVQIQSIHPPSEVAGAFRDVASAREDKHKVVRQAQGERNRRLPKARAEANTMTSEAEASAQEIVEMAHGDAERFTSAWYEYRKARTVTAHRLYMETIEEVLPKVRKVISNPQAERHLAFPELKFAPDLASPVKRPPAFPKGGSVSEAFSDAAPSPEASSPAEGAKGGGSAGNKPPVPESADD